MTTPLALELMHSIMQVFNYIKVDTSGIEYIEVFVPKTSLSSREEALLFIKHNIFLSTYNDFIKVGEMESDNKNYVLISINKNAQRTN